MFFAIPVPQNNDNAFWGTIILTLPWGILSFFFIMFAIHQGFANSAAFVCFAVGGLLNALLLYLASRERSNVSQKQN